MSQFSLWSRSSRGELFSTLFRIFGHFIVVQLLAPIVFLGVRALPATIPPEGGSGQSSGNKGTETSSSLDFHAEPSLSLSTSTSTSTSTSPSTTSFSTRFPSTTSASASASATIGSSSGTSQLTDSQLAILLSGKFTFFKIHEATNGPSSLRHRSDNCNGFVDDHLSVHSA